MSTRGCVAIGNKTNWKGVYNHFDSYPSGLGKELWEHLQGENLQHFAGKLLQYDDWRNYLNNGKCKYCGHVGMGQAHSINGLICYIENQKLPKTKEEKEIQKNLKDTGFPDPFAKWHLHGELDNHITSGNGDALFIEWVYVIDVENKKLIIYSGGRAKGMHEESNVDGTRKWKSPNYKHYFVCEVDINADTKEPDWEAIEKRGSDISNEMYEKFKKQEKVNV